MHNQINTDANENEYKNEALCNRFIASPPGYYTNYSQQYDSSNNDTNPLVTPAQDTHHNDNIKLYINNGNNPLAHSAQISQKHDNGYNHINNGNNTIADSAQGSQKNDNGHNHINNGNSTIAESAQGSQKNGNGHNHINNGNNPLAHSSQDHQHYGFSSLPLNKVTTPLANSAQCPQQDNIKLYTNNDNNPLANSSQDNHQYSVSSIPINKVSNPLSKSAQEDQQDDNIKLHIHNGTNPLSAQDHQNDCRGISSLHIKIDTNPLANYWRNHPHPESQVSRQFPLVLHKTRQIEMNISTMHKTPSSNDELDINTNSLILLNNNNSYSESQSTANGCQQNLATNIISPSSLTQDSVMQINVNPLEEYKINTDNIQRSDDNTIPSQFIQRDLPTYNTNITIPNLNHLQKSSSHYSPRSNYSSQSTQLSPQYDQGTTSYHSQQIKNEVSINNQSMISPKYKSLPNSDQCSHIANKTSFVNFNYSNNSIPSLARQPIVESNSNIQPTKHSLYNEDESSNFSLNYRESDNTSTVQLHSITQQNDSQPTIINPPYNRVLSDKLLCDIKHVNQHSSDMSTSNSNNNVHINPLMIPYTNPLIDYKMQLSNYKANQNHLPMYSPSYATQNFLEGQANEEQCTANNSDYISRNQHPSYAFNNSTNISYFNNFKYQPDSTNYPTIGIPTDIHKSSSNIATIQSSSLTRRTNNVHKMNNIDLDDALTSVNLNTLKNSNRENENDSDIQENHMSHNATSVIDHKDTLNSTKLPINYNNNQLFIKRSLQKHNEAILENTNTHSKLPITSISQESIQYNGSSQTNLTSNSTNQKHGHYQPITSPISFDGSFAESKEDVSNEKLVKVNINKNQ